MPLHDSLVPIANDIDTYYQQEGKEAPYLLYVYPPSVEFEVRRDLGELKLWLEARGVRCMSISLADLLWSALEDSGWLESLIGAERAAQGDAAGLEEVFNSVGEILRQPPTLPDRVIAALGDTDDRTAAFLYRAGALYPAYRTSTLLDDLRSRLNIPVTLLYPGRLVGSYGLRFMDRCDPTYGYRATIYARGGDA